MLRVIFLIKALASLTVLLFVITGTFAGCGKSSKISDMPVTINVVVAGDTNIAELFKNKITPGFNNLYPNVTVNVVGTGTGDAGSRSIYTKLKAQKDAETEKWDIDIALVHQSIMGDIIKDGLAARYIEKSANKNSVVGATTVNSLGTDVKGYVIPLFQSQIVLGYNPKLVKNVPKTFEELFEWIKANPGKFGYNGVKGGMSGVGFVASYIYWRTGKYELYSKGPYDKANESFWVDIMKELKSLPVTLTQGNAGTLEMLNKGEIWMGPVWVDMFYLAISEGSMDPDMKIVLPLPGMPGQPLYLIIPEKASYPDAAIKYIDYATSPQVQADIIVGLNNWYPGIDTSKVMPLCSQEDKDRIFNSITADDLNKKALSFPLASYLKDITETYENTK